MIVRWWRAGEQYAVVKYENHNGLDVLLHILFVAAVWFFLPKQYSIVPKVLAAILIPWVIAERRLAVIFTRDAVIYRPVFGTPRGIKFEHIVEMRKVRIPRLVAGNFSEFRPGVALRIVGGEIVNVPLPEPSDEILMQLSRATGKTVNSR